MEHVHKKTHAPIVIPIGEDNPRTHYVERGATLRLTKVNGYDRNTVKIRGGLTLIDAEVTDVGSDIVVSDYAAGTFEIRYPIDPGELYATLHTVVEVEIPAEGPVSVEAKPGDTLAFWTGGDRREVWVQEGAFGVEESKHGRAGQRHHIELQGTTRVYRELSIKSMTYEIFSTASGPPRQPIKDLGTINVGGRPL